MSGFAKIEYASLNARQKENYNFQKVASRLADYGFNSLRLSDDWNGADFIACHIDGETFLKVQLKGRLTIDRKYLDRNIHIAFLFGYDCFVYPHDQMVAHVLSLGVMDEEAQVWSVQGIRHWNAPPKWAKAFLEEYRL